MSTIQDLFQQAQLAEAAYAKFPEFPNSVTEALKDEGFSESQATAFLAHWRVAHHIPNTESGFSATLFERLDNGVGTGEYSLAIRGSTPSSLLVDFLADGFDIFLDGVVLDQMVDLYNYWQQLRSPVGIYEAKELVTLNLESTALRAAYLVSSAAGLAYETILRQRADVLIDKPTLTVRTIQSVNSYGLEDVSLRQGAGVLVAAPLSIDVSGHSLGGHLAMAFSRLFASLGAQAAGVNGLGFRPEDSNVNNLFALLGGAASFNPASIQNLYGIDGPEFAAMNNWILQQPGGFDGIYIESGGLGTAGGHSVTQMTDALALYNLIATLDPTRNEAGADGIETITNLLKAASSVAERSLESTLDALRTLFEQNYAGANSNLNAAPTATDDREAYYHNLSTLQTWFANSPFTAFSITSLAGQDAATLQAAAQTDLATRYALLKLNAFVVSGASALYDQINTDQALDRYDPQTGEGSLTDQWIEDRAAMLAVLIERNTQDSNFAPYPADKIYSDATRGITLRPENSGHVQDQMQKQIRFGSDANIPESINGGAQADHLYGGAGIDHLIGLGGADTLQGDAGSDALSGGAGNDTLIGGKDTDILNGGLGSDTYIWNKGDGFDIVLDEREGTEQKKLGTIHFMDQALAGTMTQHQPDNPHVFTDPVHAGMFYSYLGNGDTSGTLYIYQPGEDGGLRILDFRSGDFGIEIPAPAHEYETIVRTIVGDRKPEELEATVGVTAQGRPADIQATWVTLSITPNEESGQITVGVGEPYTPTPDTRIVTSTSNLDADGHVVSHTLELAITVSFHVLYLERDELGNYVVGTQADPDRADGLNGSAGADLIQGLGGADTLTGLGGDDRMEGGTGADVVTGGAGLDRLYGGAGRDRLNGEGDNDELFGDEDQDILNGGAGDDTLAGGTGGDLLQGGAGDDLLEGEEGDDFLDGGAGSDVISGGLGHDFILGGGAMAGPSGHLNNPNTPPFGAWFANGIAGFQNMTGSLVIDTDGTNSIDAGAGNDTVIGGDNVGRLPACGSGDERIYTSRISSFFPHAAAYLRSVATEGDCLSLASEASKRETAGGFVPMRLAICAWVRPAASRAVNSASSKASSSRSMRSTALRNAASFIQSFTMASCDRVGARADFCLGDTKVLRIIHLLFTSSGNIQFTLGRNLGFLDKAMQHHNPPLARHAVKHAGDTACILQAQLEQPTAHRAAMRHSEVHAKLLHPLGISSVARPHPERQTRHIKPHRFTEIVNREHVVLLTNMLIKTSAACAANDARSETNYRKAA